MCLTRANRTHVQIYRAYCLWRIDGSTSNAKDGVFRLSVEHWLPLVLETGQTPQRLRGLVGCNTRGGICELLSAVEYCSISLTSVLPSETPLLKGARKRPSIQLLKWYVPSGTPHRCLYPNQEFGTREPGTHDSGSSEMYFMRKITIMKSVKRGP
jgi:hypothetical protein